MEVCLDTSVMSNQQVVSELAPILVRTVECYQNCNFLAPCRQKCQTDFTQDLVGSPQGRQITRYITVTRDEEQTTPVSNSVNTFNFIYVLLLLYGLF